MIVALATAPTSPPVFAVVSMMPSTAPRTATPTSPPTADTLLTTSRAVVLTVSSVWTPTSFVPRNTPTAAPLAAAPTSPPNLRGPLNRAAHHVREGRGQRRADRPRALDQPDETPAHGVDDRVRDVSDPLIPPTISRVTVIGDGLALIGHPGLPSLIPLGAASRRRQRRSRRIVAHQWSFVVCCAGVEATISETASACQGRPAIATLSVLTR